MVIRCERHGVTIKLSQDAYDDLLYILGYAEGAGDQSVGMFRNLWLKPPDKHDVMRGWVSPPQEDDPADDPAPN